MFTPLDLPPAPVTFHDPLWLCVVGVCPSATICQVFFRLSVAHLLTCQIYVETDSFPYAGKSRAGREKGRVNEPAPERPPSHPLFSCSRPCWLSAHLLRPS